MQLVSEQYKFPCYFLRWKTTNDYLMMYGNRSSGHTSREYITWGNKGSRSHVLGCHLMTCNCRTPGDIQRKNTHTVTCSVTRVSLPAKVAYWPEAHWLCILAGHPVTWAGHLMMCREISPSDMTGPSGDLVIKESHVDMSWMVTRWQGRTFYTT